MLKQKSNKKSVKTFTFAENGTNVQNFPPEFLSRMKAILGEEFATFEQALQKPKQSAIFVNQSKIDLTHFVRIADFDLEKIAYEPNGFYVNTKLGKHPLHHAGAFYVQEPSAMFTVNAHKFAGDELVLDMCASPGGKSVQIANRITNGILVSNEINNGRSEILFSNIERMGLKNVIVTNDTPHNLAKAYSNCFDVVLVDAPCSGEGMFRRGDQVVKEWNVNLPQMCAERQMDILANADETLKQNGFLIYSTCTYSLQENEFVVKKFAQEHNYKIIDIDADLPRGIDLPQAVRLYPHKIRGEGQFVSVLQKMSNNEHFSGANLRLVPSRTANEFFANNVEKHPEVKCYEYGDFCYYVKNPDMIKKGVNYFSIGVRVGQIKNKRFEPCHNLFTAFGCDFKNKLDLNYPSTEINKYLKGDMLNVDLPDGYGAVLVEGCPVGGFKLSQGKFKNHYPKGLRNFN